MTSTNRNFSKLSLEALFAGIQRAKHRLRNTVHQTPVLSSRTLNRQLGAEVFFKCENLQRAGAFKIRGAFNCMSLLSDEDKNKGVITYSSGNHAQAVALAGQILGITTTVVMPENAPRIKFDASIGYGARVITYDQAATTREEIVAEIVSETSQVLVPPFNHPEVIQGQGTAADELFSAVEAIDTLLVPCGGGGLLSGAAITARSMRPECKVIGVEPLLANDAYQSFYSKRLHRIAHPPTIADGVNTRALGELTFPLILRFVDAMQTVTEESIIEAMQFLFSRMKLVVEPAGAIGLAALLSGGIKPSGRIGVIISGGNIDPECLTGLLRNSSTNAGM